jgi:hypothetical protein
MKEYLFKALIISVLCVFMNGCNSKKSTVNNKNQEDYNDKRQEAFDELYNEHH